MYTILYTRRDAPNPFSLLFLSIDLIIVTKHENADYNIDYNIILLIIYDDAE